MTKTSLFVSALVALFLGASAEPCPLLRAPESANKTGCYIIVLKDETSPEKFNEVLQLAVSYADGQEVYAVVENVIKVPKGASISRSLRVATRSNPLVATALRRL